MKRLAITPSVENPFEEPHSTSLLSDPHREISKRLVLLHDDSEQLVSIRDVNLFRLQDLICMVESVAQDLPNLWLISPDKTTHATLGSHQSADLVKLWDDYLTVGVPRNKMGRLTRFILSFSTPIEDIIPRYKEWLPTPLVYMINDLNINLRRIENA